MPYPQNSAGWTIPPISAGANKIFVSPNGNDGNAGSEAAPVRTLGRAVAAMRPGRQNAILLSCGGRWGESFGWIKSGGSPGSPLVIASYGQGPRPVVQSKRFSLGMSLNCAFLFNLQFRCARDDSADSGLDLYNVNDIHIEGCRMELFRNGLVCQGDKCSGLVLRRNVIADNAPVSEKNPSSDQHSQGIYVADTDGVLLDGNVFDHNGWGSGMRPTIYNHNAYIHATSSNLVAKGNVFSAAASHGIQARCGGDVRGNVFVNNPIHMSFGLVNGEGPMTPGGVTGTISGNAFMGGRDIDGAKRGMCIQLAHTKPGGNTRIANNVFANDTQKANAAISVESGKGAHESMGVGLNDCVIEGNVCYKWPLFISVQSQMGADQDGKNGIRNVSVRNNVFDKLGDGAGKLGGFTPAAVGHYPNPGLATQNYGQWVAQARNQAPDVWQISSDAAALANTILNGFGMGSVTPTPTPAAITSLALVSTDSGAVVGKLADGMTIDLHKVGTSTSILATLSANKGSVSFVFDGVVVKTENISPYTIAGDTNGRFDPFPLPVGSHSLTVTPYTGANGTGVAGVPVTVRMNVVDGVLTPTPCMRVVGFRVEDKSLGANVDMNSLPRDAVIEAVTDPKVVGSVVFSKAGVAVSTQQDYPYTMRVKKDGKSVIGSGPIVATPYPQRDGKGDPGVEATFTVKGSGGW